eukprot:1031679-Rhodomonas_salina.1
MLRPRLSDAVQQIQTASGTQNAICVLVFGRRELDWGDARAGCQIKLGCDWWWCRCFAVEREMGILQDQDVTSSWGVCSQAVDVPVEAHDPCAVEPQLAPARPSSLRL